jgi:hypothetical protein
VIFAKSASHKIRTKFVSSIRRIRACLDSNSRAHDDAMLVLNGVPSAKARGRFNFAFVFEHFRITGAHTPARILGVLPMGFIFRSVFWLALAMAILPPQARLGGDEAVDFRDVDVGLELHNAAYSAWQFSTQIMSSCESNPQLCAAGTRLWDTTVSTVTAIANETSETLQTREEEPVRVADNHHARSGKIQARVE